MKIHLRDWFWLTLVIALALALWLTRPPATATVQGLVTLNGQPLSGGMIVFLGREQAVGGVTDAQGRFAVQGCPLGEMQALVFGPGVPPHYGQAGPLRVAVNSGSNHIHLEVVAGVATGPGAPAGPAPPGLTE